MSKPSTPRTAKPSPGPGSGDVSAAALSRLIEDWRGELGKLQRLANDKTLRPAESISAHIQATRLTGCINDIDDLINGRPHPSGRRGG